MQRGEKTGLLYIEEIIANLERLERLGILFVLQNAKQNRNCRLLWNGWNASDGDLEGKLQRWVKPFCLVYSYVRSRMTLDQSLWC